MPLISAKIAYYDGKLRLLLKLRMLTIFRVPLVMPWLKISRDFCCTEFLSPPAWPPVPGTPATDRLWLAATRCEELFGEAIDVSF